MKIAIIGAGVSGLACALELQNNGIKPDIFEKKSVVGDALDYTIANLKIFDRFLGSPMGHLKRTSSIKIQPINKLKKITMISPNNKSTVSGNLGYVFLKGQDEKSLENQMFSELKIPIVFDSHIEALKIKNEYDYIIAAEGDCTIAKELGVFTKTFNGHSRIASILGAFDPNHLKMWMNTEYCKHCYVYLLPYSKERATLVLSIDNVSHRDLDYYWNKFIKMESIQYEMTETRDLEHNLGLVRPTRFENIYMIGNAGGCMDSFMGFGFVNAIDSGVMAAQSIIKNQDYNNMMCPITKDNRLKHEYRIMINSMKNNDFDRLLTFLNLPGIKPMIYRNPLYKAIYFANILKLYHNYSGKS